MIGWVAASVCALSVVGAVWVWRRPDFTSSKTFAMWIICYVVTALSGGLAMAYAAVWLARSAYAP